MKRLTVGTVLLFLIILVSSVCHGATFDKATFTSSIALWQDNQVELQMESSVFESSISKPNKFQYVYPEQKSYTLNEVLTWTAIAILILFAFYALLRWIIIAFMIIEYDKFYCAMLDYHEMVYRTEREPFGQERCYFPYDQLDNTECYFKFSAWRLSDFVDAFTCYDYEQWKNDNDWTPRIN